MKSQTLRLVFEFTGSAAVTFGVWQWRHWCGYVIGGVFCLLYSEGIRKSIEAKERQ
jgi:hypothetical protein